MSRMKKFKTEDGFTTIQSAYMLLFCTIIFVLIIALASFYYQKHELENNVELISLKVANLTINQQKECAKALKDALKEHNASFKNNIQIAQYKCTDTWVQIEGKITTQILQLPITINATSRAGTN
ncbi:hypothetical protein HCQ94_05950 [Actinomyces sp. zg-332]|uniref:hypothetical protein n=1 Tax=Actinomyces sp. zg-332 TaxID=2708340 RepID=UPI001422563A|nr:hypothetical protein [Actinomyces sp. zg-332]QPK94101.1 hypothetical protein HCQ94_05950 [Actinomyces sp. zg-332]